jgi:hypothetical protein
MPQPVERVAITSLWSPKIDNPWAAIDTGGSTGTETTAADDPPATGLHKNVISYMLGLAKACGVADATLTEHIGREYGVEALGDLTNEQAEAVKGWLNEQRKGAGHGA